MVGGARFGHRVVTFGSAETKDTNRVAPLVDEFRRSLPGIDHVSPSPVPSTIFSALSKMLRMDCGWTSSSSSGSVSSGRCVLPQSKAAREVANQRSSREN